MSKLIKFVSSIPMGMKIYAHGVDVVITRKRRRIVKKFVKRRRRRIYLQHEFDNNNDSNAIRVIGKSKGWFLESEKCLGYVPEDIADQLVIAGMENIVKARLQLIAIEDGNSIHIRFDLLGPRDEYEKYCS